MLHLFIAVALTWLCSYNTVNATQTFRTLGNDTLPDRAEMVLNLLSWPLQGPSPLRYSNFFIINEYKGWQIIRQSLCDTGPQEDLSIQKTTCQSSPELRTYEEPFTIGRAQQAWNDYRVFKQMKGSSVMDTFILEHRNEITLGVQSNGVLSNLITHFGGKGKRNKVEKSGPLNLFRSRIVLWTPERKEPEFDGLDDIHNGKITPYRPWSKDQYLPDVDPIV